MQMTGFQIREEYADNILSAYRTLIFYRLAVAGSIFLLPFIIHHFLEGRLVLGCATLAIGLVFSIDAVAIHRGKEPPIPPIIVFIPILLALIIRVQVDGIIGILWTYPVMVFFHFIFPGRIANILNVMLVLLLAPMAYPHVGLPITVRIVATFALTIIFSNIFSNIIASLHKRLHELTILDPLTGAYNRRHMETCMAMEIDRNHRYATEASLLIVDMDHFKRINDELGHTAGDRALKAFVEQARNCLRAADMLFRVGGEEFAVLMPGTDEAAAAVVAEKLRARTAALQFLENRSITVSIGAAEVRSGENVDHWYKRCDDALYAAKNGGRNRVILAACSGPAVQPAAAF